MSLFDLNKKVALITGASSGIGLQQAKVLSQAGAKVILLGRQLDKLNALTKTLKSNGADAYPLEADLNDFNQLDDIVSEAYSAFKQIDILCNTAGVNLRQAADQITSESWDETLNLNLKIPFFLAQKCIPQMAKRGWGKIINVASLQSTRAFENGIAYGASKGGIVQLTRAMAQAWSPLGVCCNAIAPGFFPTQLTAKVFEEEPLVKQLAEQTAIGRNGRMNDLDGACIFFASHASDYITGQTLYIDGGFTAK